MRKREGAPPKRTRPVVVVTVALTRDARRCRPSMQNGDPGRIAAVQCSPVGPGRQAKALCGVFSPLDAVDDSALAGRAAGGVAADRPGLAFRRDAAARCESGRGWRARSCHLRTPPARRLAASRPAPDRGAAALPVRPWPCGHCNVGIGRGPARARLPRDRRQASIPREFCAPGPDRPGATDHPTEHEARQGGRGVDRNGGSIGGVGLGPGACALGRGLLTPTSRGVLRAARRQTRQPESCPAAPSAQGLDRASRRAAPEGGADRERLHRLWRARRRDAEAPRRVPTRRLWGWSFHGRSSPRRSAAITGPIRSSRQSRAPRRGRARPRRPRRCPEGQGLGGASCTLEQGGPRRHFGRSPSPRKRGAGWRPSPSHRHARGLGDAPCGGRAAGPCPCPRAQGPGGGVSTVSVPRARFALGNPSTRRPTARPGGASSHPLVKGSPVRSGPTRQQCNGQNKPRGGPHNLTRRTCAKLPAIGHRRCTT